MQDWAEWCTVLHHVDDSPSAAGGDGGSNGAGEDICGGGGSRRHFLPAARVRPLARPIACSFSVSGVWFFLFTQPCLGTADGGGCAAAPPGIGGFEHRWDQAVLSCLLLRGARATAAGGGDGGSGGRRFGAMPPADALLTYPHRLNGIATPHLG